MVVHTKSFFSSFPVFFRLLIVVLCMILFISPTSLVANSSESFYIPAFHGSINESSNSSSSFSDGLFACTWYAEKEELCGIINGFISFGRSDTIARIEGEIQANTSSTSYYLKGFVYHRILFGNIYSDPTSSIGFFIGSIDLDMPYFSFSLFLPSLGKISGSGMYDGSFLPVPTGPYQVGVKSYHLIDESREEWFTEEDTSDFRELMVKIWYPSENNTFSDRSDYMDPITFSWLRDQGPVPLITIPKDAYRFVHPYIYEGVEPVTSKKFPVLLFSPGYDGVDSIYTSFIDDLVSHGYIVVSMNHPFVSGVTVFPDGRTVYIADRPGNFSESAEFLKRSQQTVVDDALFSLDFVEELNRSDELLSGVFDCSRIGMFGHSFGGAATINCCFLDERINAGFTLDGVVYDEFVTDTIDEPFLLMCAEQRFNHSSYDYIWNQFSSDAYQVGVTGSAHYGFTDVGLLISHLIPLIPSETLGFGTIDARYLIQITRLYENAFFDVYLKGAEKEVLTSLFDDFDEVSVRIK